jgi:hypothetical protein
MDHLRCHKGKVNIKKKKKKERKYENTGNMEKESGRTQFQAN